VLRLLRAARYGAACVGFSQRRSHCAACGPTDATIRQRQIAGESGADGPESSASRLISLNYFLRWLRFGAFAKIPLWLDIEAPHSDLHRLLVSGIGSCPIFDRAPDFGYWGTRRPVMEWVITITGVRTEGTTNGKP
jgi:hypothetical protein